MSEAITLERVQALVTRGPYHQWLGLKVVALHADGIELKVIGSNSFYDDNLHALMKLIAEGSLRPVIDKVLPLEQAREGLRLIESREVIGKVVVVP